MEQRSAFKTEIVTLQNNKKVANKSDLKSLNPFINKDGLLRIGGRLKNANLRYNRKHPWILPRPFKADGINYTA